MKTIEAKIMDTKLFLANKSNYFTILYIYKKETEVFFMCLTVKKLNKLFTDVTDVLLILSLNIHRVFINQQDTTHHF